MPYWASGSYGIFRCLWLQMAVAYLLSQLIWLYSRTSFAPMISAMVLPVMLQTETMIYIIAAVLLTSLILFFRFLLERIDDTIIVPFVKNSPPDSRDWLQTLLRTVFSAIVIYGALILNARFVVAPPLLVAFTEFSKPSCSARKKPVKAVSLIGASAFIGAAFRYMLCIRASILPLCLAAALTILTVILLMKKLSMFIPPAGAVSILAMLIPEGAVLWFPVQITVGAAVVMAAAILFTF